jgi:small-conductance mechanosensitive channel
MDILAPLEKYLKVAWNCEFLWWLVAAAASFLVLRWIRARLIRHVRGRLEQRENHWFEYVAVLLRRTQAWFLLIAAGCVWGLLIVPPSPGILAVVYYGGVVAIWLQAALWADAMLSVALDRYIRLRKKNVEYGAADVTTLSALSFLGRMTIWIVAVLAVLKNLGTDITPLIAGFGIGGVAVALAAQSILSDLFASASIILDRPFALGDFIAVDDKMGIVEHIGLKTTRLRSISGEQIIFANADLLKSRIHNHQRLTERRVEFTIRVACGTAYEKVETIPRLLREAIEALQPVRFERAHFVKFGDSGLVFEAVYHVLTSDYNVYMDVRQAVNFAVFRRFAEENIQFAGG